MLTIAIVVLVILVLYLLLKDGFAMSSVGGFSVSSSGNHLKLSGKILSVSYNNKLVIGDEKLKAGSNTVVQSNSSFSLENKGGHVHIKGEIDSLMVNGKKLVL